MDVAKEELQNKEAVLLCVYDGIVSQVWDIYFKEN